jgi:hypothetical protein
MDEVELWVWRPKPVLGVSLFNRFRITENTNITLEQMLTLRTEDDWKFRFGKKEWKCWFGKKEWKCWFGKKECNRW